MNIFSQVPSFVYTLVLLAIVFIVIRFFQRKTENKQRAEAIAKNPELANSLTADDIAKFESWLDDISLPYTGMTTAENTPSTPLATQIGGPAAAPTGTAWPLDTKGNPMIMLAQINFANVSAPPDYPEKGILQFYIESGDLFGLNFDDQLASDYQILWHPDPELLTASLAQPHDFQKDYSPFLKPDIWENGRELAVNFTGQMRPDWTSWSIDEKVALFYDRPNGEEIVEKIFDTANYEPHRIGGHPSFTQSDPRSAEKFADYDRVLLQIGCDDSVMFGDSGECTFFITQKDLKTRRFDRVLYNWDCC